MPIPCSGPTCSAISLCFGPPRVFNFWREPGMIAHIGRQCKYSSFKAGGKSIQDVVRVKKQTFVSCPFSEPSSNAPGFRSLRSYHDTPPFVLRENILTYQHICVHHKIGTSIEVWSDSSYKNSWVIDEVCTDFLGSTIRALSDLIQNAIEPSVPSESIGLMAHGKLTWNI